MITLTGTYGKANETAPTGYVDIQPMVTAVRLSTIITQAPVRADLEDGAISVDIVASNDEDWDHGPIPYVFTERINGQSAQWMAYVNGPGPVDMSDLVPLAEAPPFAPADWPSSFDYNKTTDILNIPDTWTQVNALTVDVAAGGTYLFAVSLTWHFDVTNRSALFRFSRDGGQTWGNEYSVEPGDNTDIYPFAYSYPVTYAESETIEVVMQARKESANGTLDVSFCDISFQRVA